MDAQAAARLGDEIAHGFGVAAMIAGAVAGALIGAAIVGATAATGGLAAVIIAGSVAAGGLSMFQIVKGITTIFNLPEPTSGLLINGSFNVYINGRNAMRAGIDVSAVCSGLPCNHYAWPLPLIAEGSATVYINGKPAARLQSKMVCGAHIKSGSPDTFIGGPTVRVAFVFDLESWMHTGLEALGLAAAGGALLLAAMAGTAALIGAVVIGGAMYAGMEALGDLGDRLGPGYRDLFQGVAGMAMLGLGSKLPKSATTRQPRQTGGGGESGNADALYNAIRRSNSDVGAIAMNTGIKPGNIQKVKDHVFYNEHTLDRYVDYGIPAERARFDSDFNQAQAWKRLESGTHTKEDITWLKHETAERWYESKHNSGYSDAHNAAERKWTGNPWE